MPAYYISGSNGTGKSTVGKVLGSRGYRVIETDFEPGLSSWREINTLRRINTSEMPEQPYPARWVHSHVWMWDPEKMNELLDSVGENPEFFCGGSVNAEDFYQSFTKRFGLYVKDQDVLKARLQAREPERWSEGSSELARSLDRAAKSLDYFKSIGTIIIDSSLPPEAVADNILSHI